jgi:membrane protease YdiL (CAAX protease family)
MSPDQPSPEDSREPPRRGTPGSNAAPRRVGSLVRTALLFYGLLLGVAWLIALWAGVSLLYLSPEAARAGLRPLRDPAVGFLTGALVVVLSHQLTERLPAGARLADALGAVLGRLSIPECLLLAAISGVAEEAFFRGLLQPFVGLLAASLIFGLAHFVPRRDLAPWALFAVIAGFVLGALFELTGNLVAPVVAHATINAVNLRLLSQRAVGRATAPRPPLLDDDAP